MKKHLLLLIAMFVGCSMLVSAGASTAVAAGGPPAWAGGGREHHDRGKHLGQRKKWERERDGRYRFNDDERHAAEIYYRHHRREFREHWRGEGPPIAYGYVIERPYRRYCRPVPVYLLGELPPPPYGYRYFLFGANVILVDDGYRVQDFIHVDINIGR